MKNHDKDKIATFMTSYGVFLLPEITFRNAENYEFIKLENST